ncbi:hypothetical protein DSL64_20800 [Dyadobacter luteus]|jgi:hypothetical protein|uniref:Tetratricopeptide repeat protein n=1 Tax=Dyadobacter luteus TaxID=2259619 RepID=A0A3D8Y7P1_9BACT|nr:hypothetical protein [Dyadobacter luteus]REA58527.1 hypothetical protein DSL64_20800 [Dyadobacter luteus]
MKKLFFLIVVFAFTFTTSFAQDSAYQKAMKKEIAKVISTDSLGSLQQSANAFARIAAINPKEWQPLYYGALAFTFQGFSPALNLDKKDEVLAKADELLKSAEAVSPGNSEIVALQGFVLMAKLSADAANRGQSLSGTIMATYGKALAIDGKNPRALAMLAQMELGMAQFFGNGPEKACGLAKQSQAIFDAQDEAVLIANMQPTWGKPMARSVNSKCK